jgi:general secretion pathway protein G
MKWVALAISILVAGALYLYATGPFCFCGDARQKMAAHIFVAETLRVPFQQFHDAMGRYPSTEEGFGALIQAPGGTEDRWRGPYIEGKKLPHDPWGRLYHYRFSARDTTYSVWSLGPDGVTSEDDIGSWQPLTVAKN